MAAPNTLNVGDAVTHPDWPPETVRKVVGFSLFQRLGWVKGRRKLIPDPNERIVYLDDMVEVDGEGDNTWMEAGLVFAGRPPPPPTQEG